MTRPLVAPKSTAAQCIGLVFGTGWRKVISCFRRDSGGMPNHVVGNGRQIRTTLAGVAIDLTGNPTKRCLLVRFLL